MELGEMWEGKGKKMDYSRKRQNSSRFCPDVRFLTNFKYCFLQLMKTCGDLEIILSFSDWETCEPWRAVGERLGIKMTSHQLAHFVIWKTWLSAQQCLSVCSTPSSLCDNLLLFLCVCCDYVISINPLLSHRTWELITLKHLLSLIQPQTEFLIS